MNTDCQCIIFSDEAYNAIMTETFKKDPLETGGILLGHILDNGIWIVMEVLPPGWRSTFQYAYFEYDEQFVNYVAQNESKKYEQELQLLGLWHRHPGSMDTFSGTDDGTNRTFARLHPKGAISGLVNIDPRFRLTMYHVANPLRYTKVAIEVGDDLIPEEYFKWKYYDEEKGLNPYPPQKKNDSTNTENRYEIESGGRQTTPKDSSVITELMKIFNSKYLFLLLFIVGAVLSLFSYYSYNRLKDGDDAKVLYKVFYSEYAAIVPSTDSIKKVFETDFEKTRVAKKEELKPTLILSSADSVKLQEKITEAGKDANVESITSTFIEPLLNKRVDEIKKSTVAEKVEKWKQDHTKKLDTKTAGNKVRSSIVWLSIATLLSLLLVFIPRNRHINEWLVIVAALAVSGFAVYLFSCGFTLTTVIYAVALFTIMCLLIFTLLLSLKFFKFPKKNDNDNRFWFQKNAALYMEEEKQIRQRFSTVEKTVENGVLSFTVPTDKHMGNQEETLFFQLAYSPDYENNKEIKVYLITPELDDLYGGRAKQDTNVVKIDGAGESYLDFGKLIPKDKISGIEVIRKLYEWLQKFETL